MLTDVAFALLDQLDAAALCADAEDRPDTAAIFRAQRSQIAASVANPAAQAARDLIADKAARLRAAAAQYRDAAGVARNEARPDTAAIYEGIAAQHETKAEQADASAAEAEALQKRITDLNTGIESAWANLARIAIEHAHNPYAYVDACAAIEHVRLAINERLDLIGKARIQ